ncbi:MAG: hypothetical protein KAY32_17875, partial [Candidatus Eisenbacteria sp.]|nr:hypothetical protein [Candidatus Eisenbacteria bacterium]
NHELSGLDGCIERTVRFLRSREHLGLVFADYEIYDERGIVHPSGTSTWKNFRSIPHSVVSEDCWVFTGSLTPAILKYGSFMPTSSLTVKRKSLPASGLFRVDCGYGNETDFSARCALHCESGYIDRILSRKRDHPASVIHDDTQRVDWARCMLEMSEGQREAFREHPELLSLLRHVIAEHAVGYGWGLLQEGRRNEALRLLRMYTRRYPRDVRFYRLWVKYLLGLSGRRPWGRSRATGARDR